MKPAFSALIAICLLALSGLSARAEYTVVEVNFIIADTNGDLLLSKTEYLLVALDALHKLDKNSSDAIDPDEIGDLAKDAEFEDGDSDKSGSLSVEEVISENLPTSKPPTRTRTAR